MIDVWFVRADATGADDSLLSEDERARAARFRFDDDRRRSIAARASLRRILGERLARDPRALRFVYGANGKPSLDGGGLEFNVSHSGHCIAIAVAECPVGIDVECPRRERNYAALARRFFAPAEAAAVDGAASFYATWTAKESVIKAVGGGLAIELASFVTTPAIDRLTPVQNLGENRELDGWSVLALPGDDANCYAALCARGQWSVRVHRTGPPLSRAL